MIEILNILANHVRRSYLVFKNDKSIIPNLNLALQGLRRGRHEFLLCTKDDWHISTIDLRYLKQAIVDGDRVLLGHKHLGGSIKQIIAS